MRVQARGIDILSNPLLNKGTAFSLEERDALGLHGLVPTGIETIEERSVDRAGLLTDDMEDLEPFQTPLAQARAAVAGWTLADPESISLLDVVTNARPSVMIGRCRTRGPGVEGNAGV
ncbi:MAG: malic enzyme-like NAD(P)-binding protein [Microthrixaceae bacterium]